MAALPAAATAAPQRPNIVLILADDLGAECLGCYGGTSYKTPNLDRLAAQGVRFTHGYATPLCTPTRLQLMTGQYNFRNWRAFGVMDPKEKTFGHWMSAAGYKTCIAGKWQMYSYNPPDFEPEWRGKGQRPEDAGFDEYGLWHPFHTEDKGSRYGVPTWYENGTLHKDVKGSYGDDVFSGFIMKFMERHRAEPFFVYYPMALTHGPFMRTPRSRDWDPNNAGRSDTRYFPDMVEYMDEVVGRVLAKLDSLGLRDRTLVLFVGDNGTDQPIRSRAGGTEIQGGKGLTTDAGTHVPLLASWKGKDKPGSVCEDLVDTTDFVPTIFEVAGVTPPAGVTFDGRSFLPQVRGAKGRPREWVFCDYDPKPGHGKEQFTPIRFAWDHRYKLYEDGRLHDLSKDVLERSPMPPADGREARNRLQAVLDRMLAEKKKVKS